MTTSPDVTHGIDVSVGTGFMVTYCGLGLGELRCGRAVAGGKDEREGVTCAACLAAINDPDRGLRRR